MISTVFGGGTRMLSTPWMTPLVPNCSSSATMDYESYEGRLAILIAIIRL